MKNKKAILVVVALCIGLSMGVIIGGNNYTKTTTSSALNVNSTPKQNDSITIIELKDNKAQPNTVTIKPGDYVQFNSKDGKSHNMTQGVGNDYGADHSHDVEGIESGIFKDDEGYKVQLKKPGIYNFHDHLNPDIAATVIVGNL